MEGASEGEYAHRKRSNKQRGKQQRPNCFNGGTNPLYRGSADAAGRRTQ